MAVNIGPRIGIDGEEKYRKELLDMAQQAKTLKSEMDAVTSSFDKNTSEQEKARKTGAVLEKQIDLQRKRVEALSKMVDKSTKETGENSTATNKWKEALNNAKTELNKLEKGTESAAKESSTFGDVLKANLASGAIQAGLSALAEGFKKIAAAAKEAFTSSVQWADELATQSKITGLSTQQLQEYQYMYDLLDVDVETITGSMQKLTRQMSSAQAGTGESANAFAQLGISITNSDGSLRDSNTVFLEAIDALGQVTNETERDALAMQIMGKSAMDLNPLIEAGTQQITAYAEEAHNMGYVLNEEQVGALTNVADSFARLEAAGDMAKRQMSVMFAPLVENIADQVLPALVDLVQEIMPSLQALLEQIGPLLIQAAQDFLPKIFDLLAQTAPIIGELVSSLLPVILDLITALLPLVIQIIEAVLPIFNKLMGVVVDILNMILPLLVKLFEAIQPILDIVLKIFDPILRVIDSALTPIIELIGDLLLPILEVLTPILEVLAPVIEAVAWPIENIVIPIFQFFIDIIKTVINWIKEAINWFISLFKSESKATENLPSGSTANVQSTRTMSARSNVPAARNLTPAGIEDRGWALDAAEPGQRGPFFLPERAAGFMGLFAAETTDTLAAVSRGMSAAGAVARKIPTSIEGATIINYGGVTINVQGAQGQDVRELADIVMERMENAVRRKEAVFA